MKAVFGFGSSDSPAMAVSPAGEAFFGSTTIKLLADKSAEKRKQGSQEVQLLLAAAPDEVFKKGMSIICDDFLRTAANANLRKGSLLAIGMIAVSISSDSDRLNSDGLRLTSLVKAYLRDEDSQVRFSAAEAFYNLVNVTGDLESGLNAVCLLAIDQDAEIAEAGLCLDRLLKDIVVRSHGNHKPIDLNKILSLVEESLLSRDQRLKPVFFSWISFIFSLTSPLPVYRIPSLLKNVLAEACMGKNATNPFESLIRVAATSPAIQLDSFEAILQYVDKPITHSLIGYGLVEVISKGAYTSWMKVAPVIICLTIRESLSPSLNTKVIETLQVKLREQGLLGFELHSILAVASSSIISIEWVSFLLRFPHTIDSSTRLIKLLLPGIKNESVAMKVKSTLVEIASYELVLTQLVSSVEIEEKIDFASLYFDDPNISFPLSRGVARIFLLVRSIMSIHQPRGLPGIFQGELDENLRWFTLWIVFGSPELNSFRKEWVAQVEDANEASWLEYAASIYKGDYDRSLAILASLVQSEPSESDLRYMRLLVTLFDLPPFTQMRVNLLAKDKHSASLRQSLSKLIFILAPESRESRAVQRRLVLASRVS